MSMGKPTTITLLDDITVTGAGEAHSMWNGEKAFQVSHSTSSGAGAAEVVVQLSNDGLVWLDGATFTLTLSDTVTTEGFCRHASWKYVRGKVNSISGTGAAITLTVSNFTR